MATDVRQKNKNKRVALNDDQKSWLLSKYRIHRQANDRRTSTKADTQISTHAISNSWTHQSDDMAKHTNARAVYMINHQHVTIQAPSAMTMQTHAQTHTRGVSNNRLC